MGNLKWKMTVFIIMTVQNTARDAKKSLPPHGMLIDGTMMLW